MSYYFDLMVKATEKSVKKIAYIPMNNNHDEFNTGVSKSFVAHEPSDDDSVNVSSERLYHEGVDNENDISLVKLDLSYITSNIIVCSYPIYFGKQNVLQNSSLVYKKFYRNSLSDLVDYLNKKVGRNNWKIFNLKVEFNEHEDYTDKNLFELLNKTGENLSRVSPITTLLSRILLDNIDEHSSASPKNKLKVSMDKSVKNTYKDSLPLVRCGWLDHCPPPLTHLINTINTLDKFVTSNKDNVAVIHCKMGKGRSGCLVVGYLIKHHKINLEKALEIFKTTRFNYGLITGVTIKSQLRYLNYYYYLIENRIDYYSVNLDQFSINRIVIEKPDTNALSCLSRIINERGIDYYYEVSFESYVTELNDLILIKTFEVKEEFDGKFNLDVSSMGIPNEDIKITISLKLDNLSTLKAIGSKLIEKSIGLSSIYWINLKAESIINGGDTIKVVMPFDECDNLSDRVGLLNQSVNLMSLFKSFEINYNI